MADSAIRAAGGADAPLSYLVPGAAVIRIKQIHVKYADNGAAGDWLPAVRIVDDAGHTMGTAADQGVKVTAGSDADVSFFPGVKHAAAAAATAGIPFATAELDAATTTYLAGTHAPKIDTLHTNAAGASVFSIDGVNNYQVNIAQAGVYCIYACWTMSTPVTLNANTSFLLAHQAAGMFVTLNSLARAFGNTVATARFQEATGSSYFQVSPTGSTYYYFINQQTFNNVGPLGWAIWQVTTDLTT